MKTENKIHFTKKALEALEPNPKKRVFYYDDDINNLAFAVNPGGSKVFFLYQWINRRPERIKIGRFPDISLEQAKNRVKNLQGRIANGENPADCKREFQKEPTLREFFEESYLERHAKIKKKSWEQDVKLFDLYLTKLENRRLSEINDARVFRLHNNIGMKNGKYSANRTVMLLSVIYSAVNQNNPTLAD